MDTFPYIAGGGEGETADKISNNVQSNEHISEDIYENIDKNVGIQENTKLIKKN